MELTLAECKKLMKQNNGDLYLSGTEVTSLPDGLKVEGDLYLSHTDVTSLPNNLTVGGCIDLDGTPIKSLPANLKVGGSLYLRNTPITSLPTTLLVGGSLYLGRTSITNLPENLVVNGNLDVFGTKLTSIPDNLTVMGWLDLRGTSIKSLPKTLKIGGIVVSSDSKQLPIGLPVKAVNKLKNGDYVPNRYLYADYMLTLVKGEKHFGKYTYYIGKIKGQNVVFDGKNYAHCKSFKDGVNDLIFKAAKDRGAEQYENLTLYSVLKTEELIAMYRVITGACKAGTEHFVSSLKDLKDSYTIAEAIELTKGQYGSNTFGAFFVSRK